MIDKNVAQKNFDFACSKYEEVQDIVQELSNFAKEVESSFSFDVAMRQYDCILQALLLRVAAEDGYFLEEEKQFIEKIALYGSVKEYLKGKYDLDMEYDYFFHYDKKELKEITTKMFAMLDKLIEDFVAPFAIIDAHLSKDYYKLINEATMLIVCALCGVDTDDTKSAAFQGELGIAIKYFNASFEKYWKQYLASAKK